MSFLTIIAATEKHSVAHKNESARVDIGSAKAGASHCRSGFFCLAKDMQVLSKKCSGCGVSFEKPPTCSLLHWRSYRKYCSRACMIQHLAHEDKVCANCKTTFNKRNGNQAKAKYCSEACRKAHYHGKSHPHYSHGLAPKRSGLPGGSYYRKWHILKTYGVTSEQYQTIYDSQDGVCAICQIREATCVDHHHDTDEIRGLLCRQCNGAIGIMGEVPEIMERAAEYLRRPPLLILKVNTG